MNKTACNVCSPAWSLLKSFLLNYPYSGDFNLISISAARFIESKDQIFFTYKKMRGIKALTVPIIGSASPSAYLL
jgi:hypothetical protein